MSVPFRKRKKPGAGAPLLIVHALKEATRLVTLADPEQNLDEELLRGAFVRLRPPEGTSADAVETWRAHVAAVALSVKVLPAPKADDVPLASTRVDAEAAGTIREESLRLAEETGDPKVEELVTKILDAVGA